jgi:hypothetical protein
MARTGSIYSLIDTSAESLRIFRLGLQPVKPYGGLIQKAPGGCRIPKGEMVRGGNVRVVL